MTDAVFCVQAAREFKHLVKTMHANGIEVLLDVVYNHTGEGSGRVEMVIQPRSTDRQGSDGSSESQ